MDEETTIDFNGFYMRSIDRLHALSADSNRSYGGYSHQSAIDQLYYTFPSRVKKAFCKKWDELQKQSREVRKMPEAERDFANMDIVNSKMQIISDLGDALNLLFAPPNETIKAWAEAAKRPKNED